MRRRAFLVLAAACACRPRTAAVDPLAAITDTAALGRDFMARQRVIARRGEEATAFDAVLQLRSGELVVLLLTPLGTKAHVLVQRRRAVEVRSFGGAQLPFDPRHILVDVHRAFFVRLSQGTPADGRHRGRGGGARLTEHWRDGRLLTREYRLRGGRVRVEYPGGAAPGVWPHRVRLADEGRGYSLDIETIEHVLL